MNINNNELKELLFYVSDEPLFFYGENRDFETYRLLSKEEINNYKEELHISINNIIPLIDLMDNDFLIYNVEKDIFEKLNIVNEQFFEIVDTIKNYIDLIKYQINNDGR